VGVSVHVRIGERDEELRLAFDRLRLEDPRFSPSALPLLLYPLQESDFLAIGPRLDHSGLSNTYHRVAPEGAL
jgi:hypothetical protein